MIIATYEHDDYTFGLSTECLDFTERYLEQYQVVFSLVGHRSYCSAKLNCSSCPFISKSDNDPTCQEGSILERDPQHLSLFGISKESHPEYFI